MHSFRTANSACEGAATSTEYAELDIELRGRGGDAFGVELRLHDPDRTTEERVSSSGSIRFSSDQLRLLEADEEAYGQLLAETLFSEPAVREKFAIARTLDAALRIKLHIHADASALHDLRWEALRDPADGSPLITGDRVLFSRYLSSSSWEPFRPLAKGQLRAAVAVANPTVNVGHEPGQWRIAPIDVAGEIHRVKDALGSEIPTTIVPFPTTLDNLTAHMRKAKPDIVCLICHGSRAPTEPVLLMEGDAGEVVPVPAKEFVAQFRMLSPRPRLVVLVSCRSAGGDDRLPGSGGALAALGPRLAEAGIPAVVAFQGDVTMKSISQFMPVFFSELREHGQIDRAVARARNAIRNRHDAWMPTLFTRFKDGRIWYEAGFIPFDGPSGVQVGRSSEDIDPGFNAPSWRIGEAWSMLKHYIGEARCTPIIGPGITDAVFGARSSIARHLAEIHDFPLEPSARGDLPKVTQFVAVERGMSAVERLYESWLRDELDRKLGGTLPGGLDNHSLGELSLEVGRRQRFANPTEPHRVLAHLPLPVYLTTNLDDLLADALREAGRLPQVEAFRWIDEGGGYVDWPTSVYDAFEPEYTPTVERPLVYHLCGRMDVRGSMVLTEDDHLKFLVAISEQMKEEGRAVPAEVKRRLRSSALLWLGFDMDRWDFRILVHGLMAGIESARGGYDPVMHFGVQAPAGAGYVQDPEAARRYLSDYLSYYFPTGVMAVYWGTAEDFVRDLYKQARFEP